MLTPYIILQYILNVIKNKRWEMIKEKVYRKHERDERIFKRDGFKCSYCGVTGYDIVFEIDHIYPKSRGGGDEDSNLCVACKECNRKKMNHINDEYNNVEYKKFKTKDGFEYKRRKPQLFLEKRIGITKEVHDILKGERVKQKKSMARIVNDLIIAVFGKK